MRVIEDLLLLRQLKRTSIGQVAKLTLRSKGSPGDGSATLKERTVMAAAKAAIRRVEYNGIGASLLPTGTLAELV